MLHLRLLSVPKHASKRDALCRHDDAMRHFSKCIGLEPSNEIYYSNRAAAHTALKNFRGALSDGKDVVRLKPRWARGWARVAAAHMGLEDFQEVSKQASPAYCLPVVNLYFEMPSDSHRGCEIHSLICQTA